MLQKVFTIHDSKAAAFLPPFFMTTSGQAVRAIIDCASDPQHNFARHPSDFTLFQIGEYDDSTGCLSPCAPENLGSLVQLLSLKGQSNGEA